MTWIILFFVAAFIAVVHPIQRRISVEAETRVLWCGQFAYDIGIEGYDERDLDFTLSLHPQYVTLQISLWYVTLYAGWSMYATHADCASDRDENGNYVGPEKDGDKREKTELGQGLMEYAAKCAGVRRPLRLGCAGGCVDCQPKWHGQPTSTPRPEYESHDGDPIPSPHRPSVIPASTPKKR